MYVREVRSKRKHGPDAIYVQLAHGFRDPDSGKVKTEILHSFGRKEQVDTAQIRRLVDQLLPYLGIEDQVLLPEDFDITGTWDLGGPHVLDGLWRQLQLDAFFAEALEQREFEAPVERALFTMAAQRALSPGSKYAGARWAGRRAWIPGLSDGGEELDVQHLYRAMDFLYEAMDELRDHLYFQITDLLNADVSVLMYDTTSVSFEIDVPDPDLGDEQPGLRKRGNSKKKRPDLPQIILALAINRAGLPVRHWVFPGNTADVTTVEQVVDDLRGLRPRRFLFMGDRGLVSQDNIDYLESRQLPYLLGCKLRAATTVDADVLSLRGRYRKVDDTLGVKETTVTEGGRVIRYLLCRDEQRAREDRRVREQIVAYLQDQLEGSRTADAHTRKACDLLSKRGLARYLRELKDGGLRIDRSKLREDERYDGKYVLMTSELEADAAELVGGYRDLWRAERAFRSMKSVLDIEPVYHRAPRRIIAHAHVCVLGYLLMKVLENRTGESWQLVREKLQELSVSRVETDVAAFYQTKRLTGSEKSLLNSCGVEIPPRVLQVQQ